MYGEALKKMIFGLKAKSVAENEDQKNLLTF